MGIVLAFVLHANAKVSIANQRVVTHGGAGALVDDVIDKLTDRVLKVSALRGRDLDKSQVARTHSGQRHGPLQIRSAPHSHSPHHCIGVFRPCQSALERLPVLREWRSGKGHQLLPSRRTTLFKGAALLASLFVQESQVVASAADSDSSNSTVADTRPQKYLLASQTLVKALKESIEVNRNDEEYNKKADVAKDAVREFVSTWRDDKRVKDEVSYKAITDTLKELGAFYQKNGGRADLSEEVRNRLLELLTVAETDLGPPVKEQSLISQVFDAVGSVKR